MVQYSDYYCGGYFLTRPAKRGSRTPFLPNSILSLHVLTGEFQNIGLVMYSPKTNYLKTSFSTKHNRLSKCFPDINVKAFKKIMRYVGDGFVVLEERYKNEFTFGEKPKSILELTKSILPFDDSSYQFSSEGFGSTNDLEKTFQDLYEKYVEKYYLERQWKHKRHDGDIWKTFKKPLEEIALIKKLESVKVESDDSEYEFPHVAFNGGPHIFQPISLDLSDRKHIFEKAHLWFGVSVDLLDADRNKKAPKNLKLHLMLGAPSDTALKDEFESARKLLDKVPCDHEIIMEEEAEKFARRVKKDFEKHH